MTIWQRIFLSISPIENEGAIGRQILFAERVNAIALKGGLPGPGPLEANRRALGRIAITYRRELNELAARTAAEASASIRQRLAATSVRDPTGVPPHLASLIYSRPLGGIFENTGTVGVARESTLDRAINPNTPGYGPYWRAQEFGTGPQPRRPGEPEIPTQVGRVIYGHFYGAGASGPGSRPQAQYAGGGGPHPVFIPSSQRRGPRGGAGGKGTIRHEIQARHFIRDGADLALVSWAAAMKRIDHKAAVQLMSNPPSAPGRRRR
jgi:hypothetical protein